MTRTCVQFLVPSAMSIESTTESKTNGVRPHVLDPIPEALEAFARGEFVVVVDDMDRENEGDLIIAASKITTEKMAWLIKHSSYACSLPVRLLLVLTQKYIKSGFICVCLTSERLDELQLPMMHTENQDRHKTAYCVTCDYKHGGVTTGISAHDRALTALKLSDKSASAQDFSRPGHVVPLRAVEGGVLARRGHTEASIGPPIFPRVLSQLTHSLLQTSVDYLVYRLQASFANS